MGTDRWIDAAQILANLDDVKTWALVVGIGTFAGGVLLMIRHKKHLDEVEQTQRDERIRRIEYRKFRRRTTVSSLIAATGVLLGSLYWANEPLVFSSLIALILIMTVMILGLAALDLLTVSLHGMADTRDDARKKMVQHYLKLRKDHLQENQSADSSPPASETDADAPSAVEKADREQEKSDTGTSPSGS